MGIIYLRVAPHSYAQKSYDVESHCVYEITEAEGTKVTQTITIENLRSEIHAKEFRLNLNNISPKDIVATEDGQNLTIKEEPNGSQTTLVVVFDKAVVGKNNTREFQIQYTEDSFAIRSGEVWEISIPRLTDIDTFDTFTTELIVPMSIGHEAYMSPEPTYSYESDTHFVYEFDKESISKTGITAGFGEYQILSFSLSYHLENPVNKMTTTSVALPPDTSIQRVYYDDISPKPERITIDSDGNWIALFNLEPRERIDVVATGSVEIFSFPVSRMSVMPESLAANLVPSTYWQSNDPSILRIAKDLTTPQEIYDYVVATLSYDYSRVRPNIDRLGAVEALKNPEAAICMEFTDLFIALSRAAGIPAREVNGYAYSENPEIQPLSLVADVLHAWPEYWDETARVWVPVDPTWGQTTGGVDFFNKLDLRHFTFVIHGSDDTKPFPPGSYKLGSNPQKDVFVSFGQTPAKVENDIRVVSRRSSTLPFKRSQIVTTITNYGPKAEYNLSATLTGDNKTLDSQFIEVLPPFGEYSFTTSIPFNYLGSNIPETITVSVKNNDIIVTTSRNAQIIINITATLAIFVIIIIVVLAKTGRFPSFKRKKAL